MATETTDEELIEKVPVKLAKDELEVIAHDLAKARLAHSVLKEEKHEKDKAYNEKLNVLDDQIQTLAESYTQHVRFDDVAVFYKFDDKKDLVLIHRKDNSKFLRSRPMDEDELAAKESRAQGTLFDGDEAVEHNGQSLKKTKANKRKSKSNGKK